MKRPFVLAVFLASGLVLSAAAQVPDAPTPSTGDSASAAAPAEAAPASPAAPSGPAKVAVIAFQAAVAQTNEGQRDFADLQKKFEPKRAQLKTLSDEIDSLKKQLSAQGDKLSNAERTTRTKTIDDKEKQLQRSAEDAQNDFQQQMQDFYNTLAAKVYDVLEAYVKEHGYTIVLDVSQQQGLPVLWASPATIINKQVVDAYNAKSGVPAPPVQPASTAPAPRTPPSK